MTSSAKELKSEFKPLSRTAEDLDDILKWVKQKEDLGKENGLTKANLKAAVLKFAKNKTVMNFSEFKQKLIALAREKNIDTKELTKQLDTVYPSIVMDNSRVTKSDVDVAFSKVSKGKNGINFTEFQEMLTNLAREKNIDVDVLFRKFAGVSPRQVMGRAAQRSKGQRKTMS